MAPSFQTGWDVLIIARPPVIAADFQALTGALQSLLRRGGVSEGGPLRENGRHRPYQGLSPAFRLAPVGLSI